MSDRISSYFFSIPQEQIRLKYSPLAKTLSRLLIRQDINPANGDQCWVYGSDIPHGDRLDDAVDVFLKRSDISEESKRKLLIDNTSRFYGLEN